MLELEKTGLAKRKRKLLEQVQQIQSERVKIQKHLKAKMGAPQSTEKFLDYYLEPRIALVHTFLNLPDCRRNPELIRKALQIPQRQFKEILDLLERLEIIRWNRLQDAYDVIINNIHLPKDSTLSFPAEQLTRLMVLDHLKKLSANQRFYYSVSFSANEKTRALIHEEILKLLRKTELEIKAAPSEQIYYMSFDLFPWKIEP